MTIDALWNRTRRERGVVIDSSKTGYRSLVRPLALRRFCNIDVRVIHLSRDPRATAWSVLKIRGPGRFAYGPRNLRIWLRTLVGWMVSDTAASLMKLLLPKGAYIRVNYEDFTEDSERKCEELTRFLGISRPEWICKDSILAGGHQIVGNAMKSQKKVKIVPDYEWKHKVPIGLRIASKIATLPWELVYRRRRSFTPD